MAEEAVAMFRELAATDPDRYRPGLARSLSNLALRSSGLEQAGEALAAEEEAVALYRGLADDNPGRYRPDLAGSLSSLSFALSGLEQAGGGAGGDGGGGGDVFFSGSWPPPIRTVTAPTWPTHWTVSVSGSRGWTEQAEALAAAEEAVAMFRELAATDPDRYRPDLANSLRLLADVLEALGQEAEAEAVRREAE